MRFLDGLPCSVRITIRSVVLMTSTATGAIEALAISSISYDLFPDGVCVAARHDWVLVS